MIIVAGVLHVDPAERAAYLADCTAVVAQARSFPGCLDFALSPDLLDSGRGPAGHHLGRRRPDYPVTGSPARS